jgi:hypothetical protein
MLRRVLTASAFVSWFCCLTLWGLSHYGYGWSFVKWTGEGHMNGLLTGGKLFLQTVNSLHDNPEESPWHLEPLPPDERGASLYEATLWLPWYRRASKPGEWTALAASVPLYIPAFLCAGLCGLIYVPMYRSQRHRRLGLCMACGYDLHGSPGPCSECGHERG